MLFNNIFLALIAVCSINVLKAAVISKPEQKNGEKKPWELIEAIKATSRIRGFNGTWITDNEFYYTATDRSIHKFNAALNTDTIFVTSDFLNIYNSSSAFKLSPDNSKILVRYDVEGTFRHSFTAKYAIFDIETQNSFNIHGGKKLQYCDWSPLKDRLAYVYNNNVFVHFKENVEKQLTTDGINGVFYNGVPDWVYEEEVLSSGSALWWSNDGQFLAVGVFNDTNVETFKYFLYGEAENFEYQYPKEVDLKYPKPGTNNPAVALRVFDLTLEPNHVTIKAPIDVVSKDHILQSVVWKDQQLLITWLNRRQNKASLQLCSALGECHEVKRIEEPKGWVAIDKPWCLKTTQNCLFKYWINDWYQIWNLNLKTGENVWQTRGKNFTVLKVYGYDETNDKIYYQATLESDPSVYQVFCNDNCLTCNLTDETGEKCSSATAVFSKDYSYYAASCSGPNPSFTIIFETETNREVKIWEPNAAFRAKLSSKLRPTIKYMKVPLADGSMGMAKLSFPPNLDVKKSYPLVVCVYGGPNSVRVTNDFVVGFEAYMTTKREVIYAQIDGRGTGNKGKNLLFSVNNHLGEYEVEDQLEVTKYLQKMLPYVDKNRCGIWGWSYGGFMTARTVANDTNRVFQCGISVAPVTSWLYYDSIYTERYMDVPANNWEKYFNTSVLHNVDNFRNHDFMLIHGSGDDNVHYQQSLMLAKVLEENDILFEEMTYTDENHSIGNFLPHLYHTMDRFWVNCLNLDVEDDDE